MVSTPCRSFVSTFVSQKSWQGLAKWVPSHFSPYRCCSGCRIFSFRKSRQPSEDSPRILSPKARTGAFIVSARAKKPAIRQVLLCFWSAREILCGCSYGVVRRASRVSVFRSISLSSAWSFAARVYVKNEKRMTVVQAM